MICVCGILYQEMKRVSEGCLGNVKISTRMWNRLGNRLCVFERIVSVDFTECSE